MAGSPSSRLYCPWDWNGSSRRGKNTLKCRGLLLIPPSTTTPVVKSVVVAGLFEGPLGSVLGQTERTIYRRRGEMLNPRHLAETDILVFFSQRIGIMMDGHYASAKKIKSRYPPNSLYYLEIAAVKPDTQGMGVGGAIMSWVVDRLGKSPCFLECTNERNIAFYEKYGFKLLEEKTLFHGANQSSATLFYMVRDKASLGL